MEGDSDKNTKTICRVLNVNLAKFSQNLDSPLPSTFTSELFSDAIKK